MKRFTLIKKITKAILEYGTDLTDYEIVELNDWRMLKVNYKGKESLFIELSRT